MQGSWNHDQAHHRCVLAAEYALATDSDHPKALYLREPVVVGPLDRWIAGLFDPDSIEATCAQLADAQGPVVEDVAAAEAARRQLAKHRAALEAGADPMVVAGWMAEVQGERLTAERAKVYADLGVTLTYRPDQALVEVEAVPVAACTYERVGGGI